MVRVFGLKKKKKGKENNASSKGKAKSDRDNQEYESRTVSSLGSFLGKNKKHSFSYRE